MSEDASTARRSGGRRLRRRLFWAAVQLIVLAVVVYYLLLPRLGEAREALQAITEIQPWLVVAGFLFQFGAFATHPQVARTLLPADQRPSLATMIRITFSNLAFTHTAPAGTATGIAVAVKLLADKGVHPAAAGFAVGAQSLVSIIVLNLLLWLGLTVSIPLRGFHAVYTPAAVVGIVVTSFLLSLVWILVKHPETIENAARRLGKPLPLLTPESAAEAARTLSQRAREVTSSRPVMARAAFWATLNRLLDLASLWVFLAAFGHLTGPDVLAVAFAVAAVLAEVPITPGGLGIVEAALPAVLAALGVPLNVAILGILGYRLARYWLPIPLGAISFLTLRLEKR